MAHEILVLLSLGAHPASRRPRVADTEGRALGLARAAGTVTALHAGPAAAAAALRPCLGMGAGRLVVLDMAAGCDPLPALADWLEAARPDLVLTGDRAETGEGSGMAAFWLAERLGWPLLTNAVGLDWVDGALHATQAQARGRRRVLRAHPPLLATIGRTAPAAPLSASGPASRGILHHQPGHPAPLDEVSAWPSRPARPRPRALAAPGTVSADAARREMIAPDPTEAADAILDLLERELLIAWASPATKDTPDAAV